MPVMKAEERDAFLAETRLGMLSTLADDGSPVTVPVWFEWNGADVRVFSSVTAGKVIRLQRDARASLLAPNSVSEPEAWVAFDGEVTIEIAGAIELAERLAHRYWDMTNDARRATVEAWRGAAGYLRVLRLTPTRIRTYHG